MDKKSDRVCTFPRPLNVDEVVCLSRSISKSLEMVVGMHVDGGHINFGGGLPYKGNYETDGGEPELSDTRKISHMYIYEPRIKSPVTLKLDEGNSSPVVKYLSMKVAPFTDHPCKEILELANSVRAEIDKYFISESSVEK